MFGWRRKGPHSVIAAGSEIQGPVRSRGFLELRGRVTGEIEHDGTLVIAKQGCCLGPVRAADLVVYGQVTGDVIVSGSVTICRGGRLSGNATCSSLTVKAGGAFDGRSRIHEYTGPRPAGEAGAIPVATKQRALHVVTESPQVDEPMCRELAIQTLTSPLVTGDSDDAAALTPAEPDWKVRLAAANVRREQELEEEQEEQVEFVAFKGFLRERSGPA